MSHHSASSAEVTALLNLKVIHVRVIINNSHGTTNRCTDVKIIFFYTQFCHNSHTFDLAWSSSGSYWTSKIHI